MHKTKGMLLIAVFTVVFFSGCDNKQNGSTGESLRTSTTSYELNQDRTAWLRDHLPNETLAYINIPTPWNYLFDAKADALHAVQSLPAHIKQVVAIKQGVKDNYYQYIPAEMQGITSLLLEHVATSFEVAVINYSPTAMLPTVAVGTRLEGISAEQLGQQLASALSLVDPSIELTQQDQEPQWTFKVNNMFPAFVRFDASSGQLLMFGGMDASMDKMTDLWQPPKSNQLSKITQLSQVADPSGLNLKMWLAPAKMYQLGGAFVPPEQHEMISSLGLDQIDYVWLGAESAQGQSALALHVLMPETGWRLMLPRAADWFDVTMAGKPRSVIQLALPTADQVKQVIEKYDLAGKLTDNDREGMKVWEEVSAELGFDFYDMLDAYHQQIVWVSDESGSWFAMKTKDKKLRSQIDKSFEDYFKIISTSNKLDGVEVMQAHFSIYEKLFSLQKDLPDDAAQIQQLMSIFKEHIYWYEEGDLIYMSQTPQVLAMRKQHSNPISLASWLQQNQGGDWNSAIFAYGKDIKHMPQDLYHYYLLLLQGLGDLAQVEVDLFALPTAKQLNLPESGRINMTLSSDAEKVSFKFGYEYSVLEPVLSGEGGLAAIAVMGVLAAYAIPAYRDYTVRAKIGEQLAMAVMIKVAVSEQWVATGSFVGVQDSLNPDFMSYYIDEETGTIVIDLEGLDSAFQSGDEIYLEPLLSEEGYINWICYSNIRAAYLPANCRD